MSEPQQHPAQPYGSPAPHSAPPQPPAHAQYPPAQQYPGPPYGAPQSPAPAYPGSAAAAQSRSGSLGRLAFILSLVALGIGLIVTLSFPLVVRAMYDASGIGAFGAIGNGLVLVVSVVALILGLMSMRRPGQQILAGIAIGISASAIAGIVMSWLSNLAFALAYN